MIQTIIAISLLTAYVLCMVAVARQIPASLSQSVFYLPSAGRWLWTAIIGAVAMLIMPVLIDIVDENTRFLAFFACGGLALTAVTPLIKGNKDISYKVHMAGAIAAVAFSQICIGINMPALLFCWVPWVFAFCYFYNRRHGWRTAKFWAEMTCFAITFAFALAKA